MTIVSLVTIHPNPGVKWVDLQKQIKKACDLARKHGAENVTVVATMIGGRRPTPSACSPSPRTGRGSARSSRPSWTTPRRRSPCLKAPRSPPGRRTSARRSRACKRATLYVIDNLPSIALGSSSSDIQASRRHRQRGWSAHVNAVLRLYEVSTYPGGTPDEHVQHTTANQCSVSLPGGPNHGPHGLRRWSLVHHQPIAFANRQW